MYNVKGFQHEDEPAILKDYWLDDTDFLIDGDGITDINNARVVLENEYLEYTGSEVMPVIKTIGGRELTEGTDYIVTYSPSATVKYRKLYGNYYRQGQIQRKDRGGVQDIPIVRSH